MDYGRNKKIHGFLKKSHNCNPCAQHSNTCPRGLKLKREWGNPQRFPPHTPPSLRWAGVQTTEPVDNYKKKHHPSGWCFLFGMSRAGLDSLPRPARSASNQEVRQDAGLLVLENHRTGAFFAFRRSQMNISAEEKNRYLRETEAVLAGEGFLTDRTHAGDLRQWRTQCGACGVQGRDGRRQAGCR